MAIQDSSVESNRVSIAGEWFRLPYWLPSASHSAGPRDGHAPATVTVRPKLPGVLRRLARLAASIDSAIRATYTRRGQFCWLQSRLLEPAGLFSG
jgi:hypothetical protein